MGKIEKELNKLGELAINKKISELTTIRIGGTAKYLIYPYNYLTLNQIIRLLNQENIDYKLFGKGSNILASDKNYNGCIIRLDRYFNDFYIQDECIIAESGTSIIYLAQQAAKNGLSGLEFASGIPATLGGCLYMNAGAYNKSMSDIVEEVLVFENDEFKWISNDKCSFSYRHSYFQSHPNIIIIAAKIKLSKGNTQEILDLMENRRKRRIETQPLDKPSCGSTFKNPVDGPVWKYIDDLGLRGFKIGGCQISCKHTNFIINDNNAKAQDYFDLVKLVRERCKNQYDINLEIEVEYFNC